MGPTLVGPHPGECFQVRCLQLGGYCLDFGVGLEDLVAHLAAPMPL